MGANVYRADFPELTEPGRYVVYFEGIGTSYPFEIRNDTWENVAYVSLRGIYHHRSGIELGPPHTDFWRPRPYHPDDGVKVYQSGATLLGTHMSMMGASRNGFEALKEEATDELLPHAWGGMMDAGDWDRRVQHLEVPRLLLELYELEPEFLNTFDLNIPESGNDLADVLDEALWVLDFFVRIQREDGAGSGGVEAAEHPVAGDLSWTESLPIYAYAPDWWSTHHLVATAARAAYVLRDLKPELAETYRDSAMRGMAWAENEYARALAEGSGQAVRNDAREIRNLAALELYRISGDEKWHRIFEEHTVLENAESALSGTAQRDALFTYQGLPDALGRPEWKALAREALISDAENAIVYSQNNAFSLVAPSRERPMFIGFLSGPQAGPTLARAYHLTGDGRYLEALHAGTQFGLGANPDNFVYTTGLGTKRLEWVLHEDALKTGRKAPPGITVYGAFDMHADYISQTPWWLISLDKFAVDEEKIEPAFFDWPVLESYIDMWNMLSQNEYTPWQCMVRPGYTWSYLAAQTAKSD